ncbi:DoxX family protein [Flammeovirga pectinis]|uniref:DoxX family protein n=1 Tax=Flammeovirga pectinis TaxID=2494373 RepID=A0A3Q9FJL4_9BACT|nr:BT_3928 family protein [Flammeovirga pectinis]AZQ61224.1 DoxX family protein [Flammeovirga pectinis]
MKTLQRILAIVVGLVFIISGLVKIDDPMGTAIKFEEYFHVFADDFAGVLGFLESFFIALVPYSLWLSVLFSSFEVILGVALVIGFRQKISLKATLALLIFFGFLTFYSAYFNKVTDCGCFGDAYKFSPWGSFTKDVVLLVLLVFSMALLPKEKPMQFTGYSVPNRQSTKTWKTITILVVTLFSFGTCTYAIRHLPPVDFRPYKIGANIGQMMQPQAPCQNLFFMERDGVVKEFDSYPTDPTWKFKKMEIVNAEECEPLIPDYYISNEEGEDFTDLTIKGTRLLVIVQNVSEIEEETIQPIVNLVNELSEKEIQSITITSDATDFMKFTERVHLSIPYYYADATVLKAMIRSNPGVMLVKDGTILGKWHYNDTPTAQDITTLL